MADRTITVNIDHTMSLSHSYLANQGEQITVDVILASGLWALGYDGYVDFILSDGSSYFKGPYNCSSGTISLTLGALDSVLDKDGKVYFQFVLANTTGSIREIMWLSEQVKTQVLPSILATSSAILPYVPQMVFPVTYPAGNISVVDVADHFDGNTSEDILAEIGSHFADGMTYVRADKTGVIDATFIIQSAIDSISQGVVYIPAGNYKITSKISCNKSNITIMGAGQAKTILLFTGTGDALETNNGSWDGSVYVSSGVSIGFTVWKDFTLSSSSKINTVGIRLARATLGSRIENVLITGFGKGIVSYGCWYGTLWNCILSGNTLGAEFDYEINDYLIFKTEFTDNDKHIDFPGNGTCRKVKISAGSMDGLGTDGGATFRKVHGLTFSDMYMEVYESGNVDFVTFETTCTMVSIRDNLTITFVGYTGTFLKVKSNTVKIDGNFNYNAGAVSLDITGASNVELGNNRFEGSVVLPVSSLVGLKQTSLRFPAVTGTTEWIISACRNERVIIIPRITITFDVGFTSIGTYIRLMDQATSTVYLNSQLPIRDIIANEPIDLGTMAVSSGMLLLARCYKGGATIDIPSGTLMIEQI